MDCRCVGPLQLLIFGRSTCTLTLCNCAIFVLCISTACALLYSQHSSLPQKLAQMAQKFCVEPKTHFFWDVLMKNYEITQIQNTNTQIHKYTNTAFYKVAERPSISFAQLYICICMFSKWKYNLWQLYQGLFRNIAFVV